MPDPKHPTNPEWELFDPLLKEPPRGADLLVLNEGGCLKVCHWYDGALAWGYKPVVPESVKVRVMQRYQR